ncbi:PrsW family intramembrane metalloprotease [Sandaracinus amylolyticus]|uniref:PrsW family intramembrane metalloprotease n=1 Tax=Sandaracinus amylolyticus TaxID=927083 RepID=UPI00069ED184|nr:PrsW family intramembrane metalloprotease [Sandaracinus amylolyticus]
MTESYAIASAVACVIALALAVPVFAASSAKGQRVWLVALAVTQLPMAALTFFAVRVPIVRPLWSRLLEAFDPDAARALAAHDPDVLARSPLLAALLAIEAPLTEELAKLGPLLLALLWPPLRRRFFADDARRVPVALAIGLGFGLGEIWLLAVIGSGAPEVQGLPWYALSGFIVERVMVCGLHGLMTAVAVVQLGRGAARVTAGLLGAMALHVALNLPIVLSHARALGVASETWTMIATLWAQVFLFVMILVARWMHVRRDGKPRSFLGDVRCPTCKQVYARPLMGVNLPWARYEECGRCGTWQWVRASDEVADDLK